MFTLSPSKKYLDLNAVAIVFVELYPLPRPMSNCPIKTSKQTKHLQINETLVIFSGALKSLKKQTYELNLFWGLFGSGFCGLPRVYSNSLLVAPKFHCLNTNRKKGFLLV